MFERFRGKKKVSKEPVATSDGSFRTLTTSELKDKFSTEINAIYRTSGITQGEFETHFLPVITKYLFFVQSLAATSYPAYDHLNGMVEMALVGAKNGLKIRNGMVLPTGVRADLIDKQKSRWSYLVVCSILLNAIRDNVNHCMVEVVVKTDFKSWDFSKGALGDYPNFRFRKEAFNDHEKDVSVASFLMLRFVEDDSVAWLSEHTNVFNEFMGVMSGDVRRCVNLPMFLTMETVLPNAVKTSPSAPLFSVEEPVGTMVEKVKKKKKKKKKKKNRIDVYESPFFVWLAEALDSGDLTLNTDQASCHIVEGGLFLEESVIVQFSETMKGDGQVEACRAEVDESLNSEFKLVSYEGFGRTLSGYVVEPDIELVQFTPLSEELTLDSNHD